MFITTHAALGAIVAEWVPDQPLLAFGLGLLSHFLSDIIPHGDSQLYKGYVAGSKVKRAIAYVTIDGVISLVFVLFLFNTRLIENRAAISMGILGGVLPDLLVGLYEVTKTKWLIPLHRVHFFFHNMVTHRHGDLSFPSGFAMQMVFLSALLSRLA